MTSAPPVWEPSLPTTLTQFILNLERTDSAYKGGFLQNELDCDFSQ
jgi:hypothetical protein